MNADFTDVDQEPEDRMADRKMDLKPFRGLLEGWPPGLGKGEISGEWRRQAKLPTGPFQPAWAQSSSDRVPGEVTQVLWLTPEDSWSGSGVVKRVKEGSHQKGSMDSFICRKTGPRTLGWRPSDTITLNT